MNAPAGGAAADTQDRIRFSARGRTRFIVLRPPYAQPIDRFLVRWTGWSPVTTQYALAGGVGVRRAVRTRVLLLTTIGRSTGALRTTVLPWYPFEDSYVVCGSNGGGPDDPQWSKNVDADGTCWVRVGRRLVPATAHIARGSERERVFEAVAPLHGGLRRYQAQAGRHGRDVPLVVISPRRPASHRSASTDPQPHGLRSPAG